MQIYYTDHTTYPIDRFVISAKNWTEGESMQKAFGFGDNAIISWAKYNGYSFKENVAQLHRRGGSGWCRRRAGR